MMIGWVSDILIVQLLYLSSTMLSFVVHQSCSITFFDILCLTPGSDTPQQNFILPRSKKGFEDSCWG